MTHVYPTISDEGPTSQHSPQHEFGHSQHSTCEPTHYGHTEEEVILVRQRRETRQDEARRKKLTNTQYNTRNQLKKLYYQLHTVYRLDTSGAP